ncbi:MAG: tetratricopeptide repeat protein [Spirochaetota bacterium]
MQNFFAMLQERFGINAYLRGNYDAAERWFRKVEARDPDSLSVLRNLGVLMLAKGDAEAAERYLLKEEKLYGKSFHRHAGLADLAYALGKRKEAAKRYALALQEPECAPGGPAAASRPIMEKRLAIASDEKTFENTRQAMRHFQEGQRLKEEKKYEEAIAAFSASVDLDGTNWPGLNNAGSIALDLLGDPERAKAFFQRAFDISRNAQVAANLDLASKRIEKQGAKR